jgi:hypothetical protein
MNNNKKSPNSIRFETTETKGDQNIGRWRNDLTETSMSVKELIRWQTAVDTGNPIKPGIKKDKNGSSGVDNCGEFEVFYMDIDGSDFLTWDKAIQNVFFHKNSAFMYTTRHHQKKKTTKTKSLPACDRFRIVFILPKTVFQKELIELLNIICVHLFDHDASCIEVSKIYLGNPGALVHEFNTRNRLNFKELFQMLMSNESALDKTINRFVLTQTDGAFDYGALLSEFDLTQERSIKVMNLVSHYQSVVRLYRTSWTLDPDEASDSQKYRNFSFDYLPLHCELCELENIADSSHDELIGILSALVRINGGRRFYFDQINELTREYDPKQRGRDYYAKLYNQIRKSEYAPSSCRSFCRFYDSCEIPKKNPLCNILHVQPTREHQVKQIKDYYASNEFKTIKEVRKELKRIILEILRNPDNRVHVFTVPCGIGKSHILKALSRLLKSFIIATPRHNLFDGFRGDKFGRLPQELEKLIVGDRALGFGWRESLMAKVRDNNLTAEEKQAWENYQAMEEAFTQSSKKVMTHEKLFRCNPELLEKSPFIFCDEDISSSMYPGISVSSDFIFKLTRLNSKDTHIQPIMEFLKQLTTADFGSVVERPDEVTNTMKHFSSFLRKNSHKLPVHENILDFLRGERFYIDTFQINSMQIRRLPEDKTIFVLSGTTNDIVLRQSLGDRAVFHDLGKVKPSPGARLIQYNAKSLSASSIFTGKDKDKNLELVKRIRESYRDWAFISHKALKSVKGFEDLIDDSDPWFCATEGLNSDQPKNLLVIGTKNLPPSYLKLLCACINLDYNSITDYNPKTSKTIVNNGYHEFTIMALSPDPTIQRLQMHFTESILMQAVGRARYYENDVVVMVYAAYPLPEFQQFGYDPALYADDEDEGEDE